MKATTIIVATSVVAVIGLNIYSTLLAWNQSHYVLDQLEAARDEVRQCNLSLDTAQARLQEIDCSAPLRRGAPFGGMGLQRAVNCGNGLGTYFSSHSVVTSRWDAQSGYCICSQEPRCSVYETDAGVVMPDGARCL